MNDVAHHHHEHGPSHPHHDEVPPSTADKPFTDPVCGMKVAADPQKEARYLGQTYHFCSERCLGKFRES